MYSAFISLSLCWLFAPSKRRAQRKEAPSLRSQSSSLGFPSPYSSAIRARRSARTKMQRRKTREPTLRKSGLAFHLLLTVNGPLLSSARTRPQPQTGRALTPGKPRPPFQLPSDVSLSCLPALVLRRFVRRLSSLLRCPGRWQLAVVRPRLMDLSLR